MSSKKKKSTGFTARVRALIDEHLDSNVAMAARELGVSQRGLHSLYSGDTSDPRLTMIQAILRRFPAVDARLLLLGEASTDAHRFEMAVRTRATDIAMAFWKELERDPERALRSLQREWAAEPPDEVRSSPRAVSARRRKSSTNRDTQRP